MIAISIVATNNSHGVAATNKCCDNPDLQAPGHQNVERLHKSLHASSLNETEVSLQQEKKHFQLNTAVAAQLERAAPCIDHGKALSPSALLLRDEFGLPQTPGLGPQTKNELWFFQLLRFTSSFSNFLRLPDGKLLRFGMKIQS